MAEPEQVTVEFDMMHVTPPQTAPDFIRDSAIADDAGWVDVEHLRLVRQWFDDTIEAVEGVDCPGWVQYITTRRDLAEEHLTYAAACHLRDSLEGILDHR